MKKQIEKKEKFNPIIQSARKKSTLISLAGKLGISPGIVAGRYQHITQNYKLFNNLKTKFTWEK
ncbi:MAG: hypothetical protein ACQETH_02485 [Candidatus Rifleibacteriota bacterium]